ncbi:MAG: 2-oxoglutarate dehydrogenase E1 component, partial [Planctomycetaceae bacterium]|nr:2-oxoglutarate dehydrogenase E1 component [Planctomycetaceae bacterium]
MSRQNPLSSASPAFLQPASAAADQPRPGKTANVSAQSIEFAEAQYTAYLYDRNAVSPDWREYFDELQAGHDIPEPESLSAPFPLRSLFHASAPHHSSTSDTSALQERLDQLIRNYRVRGHIVAAIDPLHGVRPRPAELDPAFYGFGDEHMDMRFSTEWFGGPEQHTLREMIDWLQTTYCRSIGVQFMHIDSL